LKYFEDYLSLATGLSAAIYHDGYSGTWRNSGRVLTFKAKRTNLYLRATDAKQ
jgi:hypothetical protein